MAKYDHIDFTPPESVAKAAEKGLEYRKKAGGKGGLSTSQAKKEGIGSGVQRAVNLKNRNTLSPDTVRRMKAFFSRHEKNKAINPEFKGEPWKDRGHVAHLLWGGDPGKTWSEKVVNQMETADKKVAMRIALNYVIASNYAKESMDFTGIQDLLVPGKKLDGREIARAIRLSIAAEHDATHLYELIADSTDNEDVKKVMSHVAAEEKVHVGEFMELLKKFDPEDEKLLEEGTKEVEEELK